MKPFREIPELVDLLQARGLIIDESDAAAFLHDFNYYRFTGYARQFQENPGKQKNDFQPGTKLSDIRAAVALDARTRTLLGSALTTIELSVRARFAHESGRVLGDEAFYLNNESYLSVTPDLDRLLSKVRSDLMRSKSPTVARYTDTKGTDLTKVPIWVAVEVLSFGVIAKMIEYLSDDMPARKVAESYSIAWEGFCSTIHSFAVLRNQCAHHNQLWHRKLDIQTPVPKKFRPRDIKYDPQGMFPAIVMLKLYLAKLNQGATWAAEVEGHLAQSESYSAGIYRPFAR